MEKPVIAAGGLSVGYGKRVVVNGLDFEVCPGEILTIIGPNGAGKTTVLKSISAQLPAISGSISIKNNDVGRMSLNDILI